MTATLGAGAAVDSEPGADGAAAVAPVAAGATVVPTLGAGATAGSDFRFLLTPASYRVGAV